MKNQKKKTSLDLLSIHFFPKYQLTNDLMNLPNLFQVYCIEVL